MSWKYLPCVHRHPVCSPASLPGAVRRCLALWLTYRCCLPTVQVVYAWTLGQLGAKLEAPPGEEFRAAVQEAANVRPNLRCPWHCQPVQKAPLHMAAPWRRRSLKAGLSTLRQRSMLEKHLSHPVQARFTCCLPEVGCHKVRPEHEHNHPWGCRWTQRWSWVTDW